MNNSKIVSDNLEEQEDIVPFLEKQKGEWSQIVEALNRVEQSEDWKKLKRLVLDDVLAKIEKNLVAEAQKKEINAPKIYHLQGQLAWAKRYSDLKILSEFFRQQIEQIKLKINYEQNPRDEAL